MIGRNKISISPVEDDRSAPLLQYAEWAPTGSGLVFVYDNDIYYKPKVLKTLVCRITSNGNVVYLLLCFTHLVLPKDSIRYALKFLFGATNWLA